MTTKVTLRDRLWYAFDHTLSSGPIALVGWLALATVLLVTLTSLVVRLATGGKMTLTVIAWDILFQALTPNPVDPTAGPWPFLVAMLFITLGSLLMVSILIGLLNAGIGDRIESLRKGRSLVVERNHTVILGWDKHIFTILSEFVVHHAHHRKGCLVILGQRDKVEMEDEIREKIGATGRARIVCRSGDPASHRDLEIVNLDEARAIIVLGPDDDDPDATVIKTLLAIINDPHRRPKPYHIVAELHDPHNLEAAQLVGRSEAELVLIGHLTSHIIAQTCRRSGLSAVYTELLDFKGDAIYFKQEPALVGRTFGQAILAYEDSTIMGLLTRAGRPLLCPPRDTVIAPGDAVIALSEDEESVRLSTRKNLGIQEDRIAPSKEPSTEPERTLVLGWNWRGPLIVREMDHYVAPGSVTTIASDDPRTQAEVAELRLEVQHQDLAFAPCDTTARRSLAELEVESYHHVVVLAYSDNLSIHKADARTLVTLLHLRDIAERTGRGFSIVSEVLDEHNRSLAEVTRADDFVVSGKMSSMLLTQIAENRALHAIFRDLFAANGPEIYLRPVADYVSIDEPVNFYTVAESARRRGEVALGYRVTSQANNADHDYGVVVNPNKARQTRYTEQDKVIILRG